MSLEMQVHVDSKSVRRLMTRMIIAGKKLPLAKIGVIGVASTRRNIAVGGRPDKWTPLSKNTIAARRKKGKGARPLRDTGLMAQSTFYAVHAPDNVQVVNPMEYAAHHQFGTDPYTIRPVHAKRLRFAVASGFNFESGGFSAGTAFSEEVEHPGIPARPFVLWQDGDINLVERLLLAHMLGARTPKV